MDIKMESIDSLAHHPENPREGDIGAIVTSIKKNGWFGVVVAQKSSGYILAGNHRIEAAKICGIKKCQCTGLIAITSALGPFF